MDKKEVLELINKLREELNNLISTKGDLLDEEVIKKSQELDELLNTYKKYYE